MKGFMAKKIRFGKLLEKEYPPRGDVFGMVKVVNRERKKEGRPPE